jgi:hypothetical protein
MKALSIKQPWANKIACGEKTIETRTWSTNYRGRLLIVSSKIPDIRPAGYALAIADLVDCRKMTKEDEKAADCEIYPNAYSWVLENIKKISPFKVKGGLRLFNVDFTNESICESSVDFPQLILSPAVWYKTAQKYVLKPEVKEQIIDHLDTYKDLFFRKVVQDIHIVGSICSTQYAPDADIDIHIVPDMDNLRKVIGNKRPEEEQREIFKFFRDKKNQLFIAEHPVEVFLQLNPAQDMLSCGVYDFRRDKWKKGPDIKPMDFNPYEVYKGPMEQVKDVAKDADLDLAELKRDTVDYETIEKAIKQFPKERKEQLKNTLEKKLKEIEDGLNSLYKHRADWIKARREASTPGEDSELEDVKVAANFEEKNVIAKMLDKYGYHRIIKQLETEVGTEVDDKEVETIKGIMR